MAKYRRPLNDCYKFQLIYYDFDVKNFPLIKHILRNARKWSLFHVWTRSLSASAFAQSDPGLHCPLTVETVHYTGE